MHKHNKMPSCLDSLIGQDNGCTSTSGRLYIKDIGIEAEFIAGLVGKRNVNLEDWMAERRRLTVEYVANDVVSKLLANGSIVGGSFVDADRLGKWPELEKIVESDAGYQNGIYIEVCTPASNTKVCISGIEFYGETSGDVEVTVYDMFDGSTVETFTVTAVAGQLTRVPDVDVVVRNARGTARLFITTDQDTFYQATMSAGCASCKPTHFVHGPLRAQSARFLTGDKKVKGNMTTAPNTGGLSVIASVGCDHEAWLCEMKPAVALPLLYWLGHEIIDTALNNYERWGVQNLRREDLEARRDQLAALYGKTMADVMLGARVPNDPHCYRCDRKVFGGVLLP